VVKVAKADCLRWPFNSLLPTDIEHIDMISTALDHCVEVKVYK